MDASAWVDEFLGWEPARQQEGLRALLSCSDAAAKAAKAFLDGLGEARLAEVLRSAGGNKPRAKSIVPQVDFLDLLPRVVVLNVLSYMPMKTLAVSCCVSQRWRHLISNSSASHLWQAEFMRLYPDSTFLTNLQMFRNYTWKSLCYLQGRSRDGWLSKSVSKRSFSGHKDRVRFALIRADMIVSSSWDRSLRVVNLADETQDKFSKLVASHSGSVYGIWFDGNVAVTCSEDSTISIWNVFKESTCVAELAGHSSAVYRVVMISSEILISCSRDFVGVWHWPSGSLLHRLQGHSHDVHRVQVSESLIVTGSYDSTVRVWSYPACQPLWQSPACHKLGVSSLHFSGDVLATGSAKGEVYVWDLFSGAELHAFDADHHNEATISCMLVAGDRAFSMSNLSLRQNDGIVCIWDLAHGMLVSRLVESFHINALKTDFGLVYCACSDGVLRIRSQTGSEFAIERELKHGDKPLYDVDVQGPRAVTCGLDKAVVLWTADLSTTDLSV